MSMQVAIRDVEYLGDSVWIATLSPEDLAVLGSASEHGGDTSIVLLADLESPAPDVEALRFNPRHARVLNQGATTRTLFVFGTLSENASEMEVVAPRHGPKVQDDDDRYRKELQEKLSPDLVEAGDRLLDRVRDEFGGYFRIAKSSGRYVNRPDNFWTAKVQPRDESIAITVRGRPDSFDSLPQTLTIKPDRASYSRFKIEHGGQLDAAWEVIREAEQK